VCISLGVVGGGVMTEGDHEGRTYGWSALSFLSSQNKESQKRSADDAKENSVVEDYDMSVSESKVEPEALIASETDPEGRMSPYRRRRNKYRMKKRKNRYEKPAASVPSQDFYEDKIYDDTYYDRDSSYQAPSSGYKAPSSSYDAPSSYEAPAYEAPSYEAPSYEAPSYEAPSYEEPSYDPPSYKPAPSYEAPSYSGGYDQINNRVDQSANLSESAFWDLDDSISRGGYSYRSFGSAPISKSDTINPTNYEYDYYDDPNLLTQKHEKHEESLFSKALKYIGGGYIGRNDNCYDEYCDYYEDSNVSGYGSPFEALSHALRTLLPLGLLMASLVPSTVTIPG